MGQPCCSPCAESNFESQYDIDDEQRSYKSSSSESEYRYIDEFEYVTDESSAQTEISTLSNIHSDIDHWFLTVSNYLRQCTKKYNISIPSDLRNTIIRYYSPWLLTTVKLTMEEKLILHSTIQSVTINRQKYWKSIYRGSVHGFGYHDFWSKCNNVKNIVFIIQTSADRIFGGYTSKGFKVDKQKKHITDMNAFLFVLVNGKAKVFFVQTKQDALYFQPGCLFNFGEQGYDLSIIANCDRKWSISKTINGSYGLPTSCKPFGTKFKVKEMEVYELSGDNHDNDGMLCTLRMDGGPIHFGAQTSLKIMVNDIPWKIV